MQDYREFLQSALDRRVGVNPRYSLRAFARDLNVSAARLSGVLNKRYGLSRQAAVQISDRLGLNTEEMELFCDLVDAEHARSKVRRRAAQLKLAAREAPYSELQEEYFRVIADWYHFAILELVDTKNCKKGADYFSTRLGISIESAANALRRLKKLGLLVMKDGKLTVSDANTTVPGGPPSSVIRSFHRQVLQKALLSLELDAVSKRDFSAVIFSCQQEKLQSVRENIKLFRRHISGSMKAKHSNDSVYCISVQLFPLSRGSENG